MIFSGLISINGCLFLLASPEPTSAPVDLFIEDKNDTSVTIIWSQPEQIGDSGLDGYTIELCKDGSKSCCTLSQVHHILAWPRKGSDRGINTL